MRGRPLLQEPPKLTEGLTSRSRRNPKCNDRDRSRRNDEEAHCGRPLLKTSSFAFRFVRISSADAQLRGPTLLESSFAFQKRYHSKASIKYWTGERSRACTFSSLSRKRVLH